MKKSIILFVYVISTIGILYSADDACDELITGIKYSRGKVLLGFDIYL